MEELDLPPLRIDADGVRRYAGNRLLEGVRWADLVRVTIRTTDQGPITEDMFWVLHAQDGTGCVVGSELSPGQGLLAWLQRLPGFDNQAVIDASSCTEDKEFLCWQGKPGDGLAAAGLEASPQAPLPAPPPPAIPRKVSLRDERDERGTRHLEASFTDGGDLLLAGQDLGRGVSDFFGEGGSEYEFAWSVKRTDLPRLLQALGGAPGADLLELLAARFTGPAAAGIQGFLEEHRIPAEFWSRVGD
ncbi:MAG TPA: hypothetical protein PK668_20450 [Myxococcota bacterium]|nr:hypothetical protein [Myxococcota bacterium]HRY96201.1 hypothetical protein [Myxococcota bacterium]HSA24808.1 hypothetical protein [Myxococcota bacterium]